MKGKGEKNGDQKGNAVENAILYIREIIITGDYDKLLLRHREINIRGKPWNLPSAISHPFTLVPICPPIYGESQMRAGNKETDVSQGKRKKIE